MSEDDRVAQEMSLVAISPTSKAKLKEDANSLNQARKLRKHAEHEVQALENRILLLKKEEERARQRILQTKKRAEEIVRMREENLLRKRELLRNRADVHPAGGDPNVVKQRFMDKELAKAARRKYIKQVYDKKKEDAREFRTEKMHLERDLTTQRKQAQEEARRRKQAIKTQREEAMRKVQRDREKQRLQARLEYKRRIESEKQAIKSFESKAHELETLEAELIERLQHTQKVQKKAYDELEVALTSEPSVSGFS